jgi:hypothetical protein
MTKEYAILLEGVDALTFHWGLFATSATSSVKAPRDLRGLWGKGGAWLAASCRHGLAQPRTSASLARFAPGSLDLGVRAPRLVDVAPEVFAQQPLFPAGTEPDATAFNLFLDAAEDAAAGRRDSERLDAGVLEVLARTGALFPGVGPASAPDGAPDPPSSSIHRR